MIEALDLFQLGLLFNFYTDEALNVFFFLGIIYLQTIIHSNNL